MGCTGGIGGSVTEGVTTVASEDGNIEEDEDEEEEEEEDDGATTCAEICGKGG